MHLELWNQGVSTAGQGWTPNANGVTLCQAVPHLLPNNMKEKPHKTLFCVISSYEKKISDIHDVPENSNMPDILSSKEAFASPAGLTRMRQEDYLCYLLLQQFEKKARLQPTSDADG